MKNMPNTIDALNDALATIIEILKSLFEGLAKFTDGFKKHIPALDGDAEIPEF